MGQLAITMCPNSIKGFYNYNNKFHPYGMSLALCRGPACQSNTVTCSTCTTSTHAWKHQINVYYHLFCQDSTLFFSNEKTTLLPKRKVTHAYLQLPLLKNKGLKEEKLISHPSLVTVEAPPTFSSIFSIVFHIFFSIVKQELIITIFKKKIKKFVEYSFFFKK